MKFGSNITRREALKILSGAALSYPLFGVSCGGSGGGTTQPPSGGYTGTDDQLLDEIERAAFDFFWNEASATTGQVKDRALATGGGSETMGSIAATGFGLTALCIGDQRGYGNSGDIKARVITTLDYLLNHIPQNHGFFYHFFDINTGTPLGTQEISSIDSSMLLCGVLTARQHFSDAQIQDLATQIYNRVEWPWMLNGGTTFSMGYVPSGFIDARWEHYCELMMLYLLAIGSPTYPVSPDTWNAWSRPSITYAGIQYISGAPPLFTHQFSHAWFDFRSKHDAYTDYFQNSVKATQAHKQFCLSLRSQFSDYGDNLWGISSSDSAQGYQAWGGPPAQGAIDGTVVPNATAGSLPFWKDECLKVLRNIRGAYGSRAWRRYGFVDAFNPLTGWYDTDVIGIDVGITMLMAENARTGFVWNTFMKNSEAATALAKVGFTAN